MVRTSQSLKEKARDLIRQANELEKKEKYEKIIQAGELVKGYFDKDFADFDLSNFKGLVRGIFTDVMEKTPAFKPEKV